MVNKELQPILRHARSVHSEITNKCWNLRLSLSKIDIIWVITHLKCCLSFFDIILPVLAFFFNFRGLLYIDLSQLNISFKSLKLQRRGRMFTFANRSRACRRSAIATQSETAWLEAGHDNDPSDRAALRTNYWFSTSCWDFTSQFNLFFFKIV